MYASISCDLEDLNAKIENKKGDFRLVLYSDDGSIFVSLKGDDVKNLEWLLIRIEEARKAAGCL